MRRSAKEVIAATLAEQFPDTACADVIGRRRAFKVARWACMAAVREQCPHLSFPQIGKIFERDHTTILYGVNEAYRMRHRATLRANVLKRQHQAWLARVVAAQESVAA